MDNLQHQLERQKLETVKAKHEGETELEHVRSQVYVREFFYLLD